MTVATRYKLYKKGKITKEQFLYEVRKDSSVPFITPLTSFTDAVAMLKQRRIISEVFEMGSIEEDNNTLTKGLHRGTKSPSDVLGEESAGHCSCGGTFEPHEDSGEVVCDTCGEREAMSEEAQEFQPEEWKDYERDNQMVSDYEEDTSNAEMSKHDASLYKENAPSLKEQVKDFVKKAMEGGSSMDEAKEQAREYFSTEKAALNEAAKPKLGVDHVNPYELKKGIEFEMGYADKAAPSHAEASLMNIAGEYAKAQSKALKNLNKDPMYYTRLKANNGKKEKKEKEVKVVWDGYIQGKLAEEDKANVTNKKEGPVKTPGVKVMKEVKVTEDRIAKIREYVTAQLKKESGEILQTQGGEYITAARRGEGKKIADDLKKKGITATVKTVN